MASFFNNIADKFRTLKRSRSTRKKKPDYVIKDEGDNQNTQPEYPTTAPDSSLEEKYATLPRGSTLARTGTLVKRDLEPNNFWEIRGYKTALKRCNNGHELGNSLVDCLIERAKLEEEYSKSLKKWNKDWTDYLNTQIEYGTGREAWSAMLKSGEEVAGIHTDLSEKLQKTPISKLKTWLNEKYQKLGGFKAKNFKQRKDFEDDFITAQSSWEEYIKNIKQFKKDYYSCVKKQRQALENSETVNRTIGKTDEQKKKAFDEYESAKRETERAEKAYKDEIQKLELYVPIYEREMKTVFEQTNKFEECRRNKFKEIYLDCHLLFKEQVENEHYKTIFENYLTVINQINNENDIKLWSKQYGADMPLIIPKFEDYYG